MRGVVPVTRYQPRCSINIVFLSQFLSSGQPSQEQLHPFLFWGQDIFKVARRLKVHSPSPGAMLPIDEFLYIDTTLPAARKVSSALGDKAQLHQDSAASPSHT